MSVCPSNLTQLLAEMEAPSLGLVSQHPTSSHGAPTMPTTHSCPTSAALPWAPMEGAQRTNVEQMQQEENRERLSREHHLESNAFGKVLSGLHIGWFQTFRPVTGQVRCSAPDR